MGWNGAWSKRVAGDRMALAAHFVHRLTQKLVVFAAMRVVAIAATITFGGPSMYGFVLVQIRPHDIVMAVFAYTIHAVALFHISGLHHAVAANTGDVLLPNGVGGTPHELGLGRLMTVEAEERLVITKQRILAGVDGVTRRTVVLLQVMRVLPVILHFGMGNVTRTAKTQRVEAGHAGRIPDIIFIRVFDVNFAAGVATDAGDSWVGAVRFGAESVDGHPKRNVESIVASQTGGVIRGSILCCYRTTKSHRPCEKCHKEDRHYRRKEILWFHPLPQIPCFNCHSSVILHKLYRQRK